jgi:hypothetical protein
MDTLQGISVPYQQALSASYFSLATLLLAHPSLGKSREIQASLLSLCALDLNHEDLSHLSSSKLTDLLSPLMEYVGQQVGLVVSSCSPPRHPCILFFLLLQEPDKLVAMIKGTAAKFETPLPPWHIRFAGYSLFRLISYISSNISVTTRV